MFGKGCEGTFFNIPGVAYGVVKAGGIVARFQCIKRLQYFCNSKNISKMLMPNSTLNLAVGTLCAVGVLIVP